MSSGSAATARATASRKASSVGSGGGGKSSGQQLPRLVEVRAAPASTCPRAPAAAPGAGARARRAPDRSAAPRRPPSPRRSGTARRGPGPARKGLEVVRLARQHDGGAVQGLVGLAQVIEGHGGDQGELHHHLGRRAGLGQAALGVEQPQLVPLARGGQLHRVQVRRAQQRLRSSPGSMASARAKASCASGTRSSAASATPALGVGLGEVRLERGGLGGAGQRLLVALLVVVAAGRLQGGGALGAADGERGEAGAEASGLPDGAAGAGAEVWARGWRAPRSRRRWRRLRGAPLTGTEQEEEGEQTAPRHGRQGTASPGREESSRLPAWSGGGGVSTAPSPPALSRRERGLSSRAPRGSPGRRRAPSPALPA